MGLHLLSTSGLAVRNWGRAGVRGVALRTGVAFLKSVHTPSLSRTRPQPSAQYPQVTLCCGLQPELESRVFCDGCYACSGALRRLSGRYRQARPKTAFGGLNGRSSALESNACAAQQQSSWDCAGTPLASGSMLRCGNQGTRCTTCAIQRGHPSLRSRTLNGLPASAWV